MRDKPIVNSTIRVVDGGVAPVAGTVIPFIQTVVQVNVPYPAFGPTSPLAITIDYLGTKDLGCNFFEISQPR